MEVWDGVLLLLRILTATVLIVAGAAKLQAGRAALVEVIVGYRLILGRAARLASSALPAVEIVLGLLLLFGVLLPIAAALAAALFATFAIAIAVAIARRQTNDCGCFEGRSRDRVRWRLAYRNLVLIAFLAASSASTPALIPLNGFAPLAQLVTAALLVSSTAAVGALAAYSSRQQHQVGGGQP
jgi:hypothetical protein